MSVRYLYLIILVAIAFVACQHEVDDTLVRPSHPTSNDSIYLKQYVRVDTTEPSGMDTLYKFDFYYDNQKRITGYLFTEYDNSSNTKIFTNVKYYYNGSDTLPFKTSQHIQDRFLVYLDTTFYTYTNGKVSSDSIRFYRENNHELLFANSTTFTQMGTNVFVKIRRVYYVTGSPLVTSDSGLVTVTMTGNNISTQTSAAGILFWNYSKYTYDDKVNPFYRIEIRYPIIGYEFWFEVAKNNFLTLQNGAGPSNLSSHYMVNYTYRSDGYPLTAKESDLMDLTYTSKAFYFYTK